MTGHLNTGRHVRTRPEMVAERGVALARREAEVRSYGEAEITCISRGATRANEVSDRREIP